MILSGILGALAVVSFFATLWQWLAARRFPLHRRNASLRSDGLAARASSFPAGVTLLKPLQGADEFTELCLRSWLAQDYAGEIQVLFGVEDKNDPVCAVVNKLLAEFPQREAQLVVCPERSGANAKVSKLVQLEPLAKHEIIVVSDADVLGPPDLLANVVVMLREQRVGLVSCFYRFANPLTLAMHWEAAAVNADFWSQVLQGNSFRQLDFALGAVMATRRNELAAVGGFRSLVDCLADDYQLGNRIARHGRRIEICPVVAECWSPRMGWRDVWRHQLRWARTIRVCVPVSYFFSIISNATLWPLLWGMSALPSVILQSGSEPANPGFSVHFALPWALLVAAAFLLVRVLVADGLQRRLTPSHAVLARFWFVPMKDLLQVALWVGAFTGNRIEWRGEWYRVRRDGTLVKQ